MVSYILTVGLFLVVKHWVADALAQTPYQYKNKGNWRHPGGYVHAAVHTIGTAFAITAGVGGPVDAVSIWLVFSLAIFDGSIHYIVDYLKVNLNKPEWSRVGTDRDGRPCLCVYSDTYFYALIADQCAHFATYIIILYILVGAASS